MGDVESVSSGQSRTTIFINVKMVDCILKNEFILLSIRSLLAANSDAKRSRRSEC